MMMKLNVPTGVAREGLRAAVTVHTPLIAQVAAPNSAATIPAA